MTSQSRTYPERPWVGVGVVVWKGDRVLMIRRARPPRLGEWSLPGGVQEVGETLFETAVREVREEAGIEVAPLAVITAVDGIMRDDRGRVEYHYTLVEVQAEWVSGELVAETDIDAAEWVSPEAVPDLVRWGETARVVQLAQELRRSLP